MYLVQVCSPVPITPIEGETEGEDDGDKLGLIESETDGLRLDDSLKLEEIDGEVDDRELVEGEIDGEIDGDLDGDLDGEAEFIVPS